MTYNWSGKKILIVEDNGINCLLFEHILRETDLDFNFARSSKDFFNLINNTYDLILMDINIGEDISGIDLIEYMLINDIDIPVIIQSALDDNSLDIDSIKHIDIIRKPININEFLLKLNDVLK